MSTKQSNEDTQCIRMKVLLATLCVLIINIIYAKPDEKYTTKYDNIDLDQIIKSDRLMGNYISCVMERGRCTADGLELKRVLPDAIKTDCAKCSAKQKDGSKKVLRHLVKNKRHWFDELIAKYDPEGVYRARYREEYAKEGITL